MDAVQRARRHALLHVLLQAEQDVHHHLGPVPGRVDKLGAADYLPELITQHGRLLLQAQLFRAHAQAPMACSRRGHTFMPLESPPSPVRPRFSLLNVRGIRLLFSSPSGRICILNWSSSSRYESTRVW